VRVADPESDIENWHIDQPGGMDLELSVLVQAKYCCCDRQSQSSFALFPSVNRARKGMGQDQGIGRN
jgi:hypothetical protein